MSELLDEYAIDYIAIKLGNTSTGTYLPNIYCILRDFLQFENHHHRPIDTNGAVRQVPSIQTILADRPQGYYQLNSFEARFPPPPEFIPYIKRVISWRLTKHLTKLVGPRIHKCDRLHFPRSIAGTLLSKLICEHYLYIHAVRVKIAHRMLEREPIEVD